MRTKAEFEERWPTLMADIPCGFYCPKGWSDLVWNLIADIDLELNGDFTVFDITQVKEKFGGLRFYYQFPNSKKHKSADYISQLVEQAEGDSWGICLTCGTTEGVKTKIAGGGNFGWVASQCDDCRENYNPRTPRSA